ncbi:MAG: type IV toxin-antitoxin system AbiEi family antitoxin domain-containing protein [bacterium]
MSHTLRDKLSTVRVFTLDEAVKLADHNQTRRRVRWLLNHYVRAATLGRIRSSLYYLGPRGQRPPEAVPDRFLVASKLDSRAVLAYHTALELLGGGYSAWNEVYALASRRHWHKRERFTFQGVTYRTVFPSLRLGRHGLKVGIATLERLGQQIRVTGRARTLVDCMDRLEYAGGLAELLNSVVSWPSVDARELIAYLHLLNRRVLYARAGFVLERFKEQWGVSEDVLEELHRNIPRKTTYLDSTPGRARYIRRWRLMVPPEWTRSEVAV